MNRPSIVVFAYSEPGYTCLKALIEAKANILAVYTHQDDPDEKYGFILYMIWLKLIIYLYLDQKNR